MANEIITIEYNGSVATPAGWRHAVFTATAEKISPKRCRIVEVTDIDGHGNSGYASLTGANRQRFSVGYFAGQEEGKTKNLSSCTILED